MEWRYSLEIQLEMMSHIPVTKVLNLSAGTMPLVCALMGILLSFQKTHQLVCVSSLDRLVLHGQILLLLIMNLAYHVQFSCIVAAVKVILTSGKGESGEHSHLVVKESNYYDKKICAVVPNGLPSFDIKILLRLKDITTSKSGQV